MGHDQLLESQDIRSAIGAISAMVTSSLAFVNLLHTSSRVTPAMEAGITDHVWSIEEVAALPG